MKPNRFYVREFLNRRGYQTSAHIIFEVRPSFGRVEKGTVKRRERNADVCFEIMDCNRKVALDFWLGSAKKDRGSNANVLAKAHRLQQRINEFVAALEQAKEWIEEESL